MLKCSSGVAYQLAVTEQRAGGHTGAHSAIPIPTSSGEQHMRKEMKKVLLCAVFAVMSAAVAFAQGGTQNIDQNIAKYTEALRLDPNLA